MRYSASEKLEIIRLVEQSHLPVRRTLEKLGILPGSFYRWLDRYQAGGLEALEDKPSRPTRVWNRIPDDVRRTIIEMALDEPQLSPRELATRFARSGAWRPANPVDGDQHFQLMTTTYSGRWRPGYQVCGWAL